MSSPAQFFEAVNRPLFDKRFSRRPAPSGETRLAAAILEDAVRHVFGKQLAGRQFRREREEARAWFASDRVDHPFTFLRICETLNIEASAARKVLGLR